MIKKLLLLLVSLGVLLLLSGCVSATCSSSLVIDNAEGAGTRTLSFKIDKDKKSVFYANEKNDGRLEFYSCYIYNNSTYFPKGYQAFADYVISQLPDKGYTATVDESNDRYVYINFSYSFDSFEEYAEKTRALMGEDKWAEGEFAEPQLYISRITSEVSVNYGKIALTFAESRGVGEAIMAELLETGFSTAAVEAGVLSPYGDAFTNPDCLFAFDKASEGYDVFLDYANGEFLAIPSAVCRFNLISEYSFMGKERSSYDDSTQITCYVEDDGSYELTHAIPEYLGVASFKVKNETEKLDGTGTPLLVKYAPGEDSLATLPDQSEMHIILDRSINPYPDEFDKPEKTSSDKLITQLVTWSCYILCACIAIGVSTVIFKKLRKIRR